jgi:hypothetical protein
MASKESFVPVNRPHAPKPSPSGSPSSIGGPPPVTKSPTTGKTVYIYRGHKVEAHNIQDNVFQSDVEESSMSEVSITKITCSMCGCLFFVQNKLPPFITLCPHCNNEEEVK